MLARRNTGGVVHGARAGRCGGSLRSSSGVIQLGRVAESCCLSVGDVDWASAMVCSERTSRFSKSSASAQARLCCVTGRGHCLRGNVKGSCSKRKAAVPLAHEDKAGSCRDRFAVGRCKGERFVDYPMPVSLAVVVSASKSCA